jgi:hypothetical protein
MITKKTNGVKMNKEVTLLKAGDEKVKKITRVNGDVDYFLEVDKTGDQELDWLPIDYEEVQKLKGGK